MCCCMIAELGDCAVEALLCCVFARRCHAIAALSACTIVLLFAMLFVCLHASVIVPLQSYKI